jgi:pimeloyl-ACP methyl ester carboxylesterase
LVLATAAVIIFVVTLSDIPARPVVGETRHATSGRAIIEYHASGPGEDAVVVFFPSFARSAADFNELVSDLSAVGFRTLAVQPRGIQGSTLPSGDPTYHTYAADLLAVLDAEGVREPVHALGHAFGNRIARTFASDYPERTRSVVLLAAGGAEPTPPEVGKAIGKAMRGLAPDDERREAIAFAFFARGNQVPSDWMQGWYPQAGLAEHKAVQATPYAEWGHAGTASILVLQPAEDLAAESGGRLLAQAFPDRVELVEVAGAGHALLPEQPAVVSKEVRRFLSAH